MGVGGNRATDNGSQDPVLQHILQLVPAADDEDVIEAILQDAPLRGPQPPPLSVTAAQRAWARLKAAAALALLAATLWPSLLLVCAVTAYHWLVSHDRPEARHILHSRKTAIVSGGNKGKSLHVCRHLHRGGWRVVLVETHKNWACGTRLSTSVAAFYTTPVPNRDPVGYLKAISAIAARERAQLFVPVSIAQHSVYEALAAHLLPAGCAACTLDAPAVALLNDKNKFAAFARRHGLPVPKSIPVTSRKQLLELNQRPDAFGGQRYLLKSVHYATLARADMFTLPCDQQRLEAYTAALDISPRRPWLLQQLLGGKEYASYSLVRQGRLLAHADNEAELSCLNYAHVGVPEILRFVEGACGALRASGQVCFDFMLNESDGRLYSIECNPRTSTNLVSFYNHPALAPAFEAAVQQADPAATNGKQANGASSGAAAEPQQPLAAPLQPLPSARPVYWLWNEVAKALLPPIPAQPPALTPGALRAACAALAAHAAALPGHAAELARTLAGGQDAVLAEDDALPFLGLHYLQIPVQLVRVLVAGTPWSKVDLCSGKVVELGGD